MTEKSPLVAELEARAKDGLKPCGSVAESEAWNKRELEDLALEWIAKATEVFVEEINFYNEYRRTVGEVAWSQDMLAPAKLAKLELLLSQIKGAQDE